MSFNFPNSPTQGQLFTPIPGGFTYTFIGAQWMIKVDPLTNDAPVDGNTYARKNAAWVIVTGAAPDFVKKIGDTMTGPLSIDNGYVSIKKPGDYPGLFLDYGVGFGGYNGVTSNGANRYQHYFDDSGYYLKRYNNAGASFNALTIDRLTGAITIEADPTVNLGVATKQYVDTKVATGTGAPLNSPAFTGNPTAPTATAGDNDTSLATTAFVTTAVSVKLDSSAYTAADVLTKIKTVDGAASGLDADLLDAHDTAYFLDRGNHTGTQTIATITSLQTSLDLKLDASAYTAADVLTKLKTVDGIGSGLDADILWGNAATFYLARTNHTGVQAISTVVNLQASLDLKLDIASYTAADVLTKVKTVDGVGSGLDADLLDGSDGAQYLARANHTGTQAIATVTGLQAGLDSKISDGPSDGSTYARKDGVWNKVLPLTGGTLTGTLQLAADPSIALQAATKQYVDNKTVTVDLSGYYTKTQADTKFFDSAGDVVTGGFDIDKSAPTMYINGRAASGTLGQWIFAADWSNRIAFGMLSESAGADLFFERYNNSGVWVDYILKMSRTTGIVDFTETPTQKGGQLITGGAIVASSAPSSPKTGQIWFKTTDDSLNIWNGTAWKTISGGAPLPTLTISGTPVTTATQGTAYAGFTCTAGGGDSTYTYSLVGTWPTGITVNSSSGVVSGTPTNTGTFASLSVRVTDGHASTADLSTFTLTVAAAATEHLAITDTIADTNDLNSGYSRTYTAKSIGTAASDRIVLFAFQFGQTHTGRTTPFVTCGGVEMMLASCSDRASANCPTQIYALPVASGTTADFAITFNTPDGNANVTHLNGWVMAATGVSLVPADFTGKSNATLTNASAVTLDISAKTENNGLLIAIGGGDTPAGAAPTNEDWTGVTKDQTLTSETMRTTLAHRNIIADETSRTVTYVVGNGINISTPSACAISLAPSSTTRKFVWDTFERTDAALASSPTPTGFTNAGDWVWDGRTPQVNIVSGRLTNNNTNGPGTIYSFSVGSADHWVEWMVDNNTASNGPFAIVRGIDYDNFIGCRSAGTNIEIYRREASNMNNIMNTDYTGQFSTLFRMEAEGTALRFYRNGELLTSFTLASPFLTPTKVGIVGRSIVLANFLSKFRGGAL